MINDSISIGIQTLKSGKIIAYPSEGVWGLGCDPFNQQAVERIIQLKGRGPDKGLILVASSLEQISPLFNVLTPEIKMRLEQSCPGADTWLIPDPDQFIPAWIKGKFATVAVRVSQHPIVKELCDGFGLIVSTSANPEGLPPAKNAAEVQAYFPKGKIDNIVLGALGSQKGSSVIKDLLSGKTLRSAE